MNFFMKNSALFCMSSGRALSSVMPPKAFVNMDSLNYKGKKGVYRIWYETPNFI